MAKYFSPSTAGFYDDAINQHWPDDARPITHETYDALMQAISDGQMIGSDGAGNPIACPPPPPTMEKLLERMRRERNARLAACDHMMMYDYPIAPAHADALAAYRQALRDLPETITDPANITWPTAPTEGV
jgi:hypothetical protein